MANLKQITLPSGNTYDIVDQGARDLIAAIEAGSAWLGITTTPLVDGSTTNPIVISGESITAKVGNMTSYQNSEFIFNGTIWQEFGNLDLLGELAYKDNASTTYAPAGSVSQPTFTGTQATISSTYTPAGTVSKPGFTGTQGSVSVSGTPSGSIEISTGSGTANYTPAGTVSKPTFSGTATTSTGNFTPEGTVSTPTITVTPNTTTVNSITAVGTLPDLTFTVANENLTIAWSAGTLPTKGANTTVATGIKSATSSQPTFTGTQGSVSVSGTPSGSVSQPTFTGTGVNLEAEFTGTSMTSTGNFTPEGTISQPTFSGTEATISSTYTPAGTVSKPTFTGTQATITVS